MTIGPHPASPARSRSLVVVLVLVATLACSNEASPPSAGSTTAPLGSDLAPAAVNTGPTTIPRTVTTVPPLVSPGEPGDLIDARPVDGPPRTRAWHITYHSRSVDGRDIAVTGLLVAPERSAQDIPIVTWGHPTAGSADQCAPSVQGTVSVPFPELLTANGMAIVSTDYEGLGTSDAHPYLVGESEAHALLDAVRAARQVADAGVTARSPTIIWGFSQGGHAAGFAGQLAPSYAPELLVKGVVVAAPVSSVTNFARRAEGRSDQFGVLVTIVGGFAHAYPELDLAAVFTPQVVAEVAQLEQSCIGEINIFFNRALPEMLLAAPTAQEAFATRFAENELGQAPIGVPVLVVQGAKDDIVDPADTQALVDRWCAQGVGVEYVIKPDAKHGVMSDQPYLDWIQDRLADRDDSPTCPASDPEPPGSNP